VGEELRQNEGIFDYLIFASERIIGMLIF
jgi:hypothetical protein